MKSNKKNIFTPGGTSSGNPPALLAAEPHSDSGGGSSLLQPINAPVVDPSATGSTHTDTRENTRPERPEGNVSPGSISDRLNDIQLSIATDDDMSSKGSTAGYVDSDTEKMLLEEDKAGKTVEGKKEKRELGREQKAKNGYRKATKFLKKMSMKNPDDLTIREKEFIRLNKKIVERYEKRTQTSQQMETIVEETQVENETRASTLKGKTERLQWSDAVDSSPRTDMPKGPKPQTKGQTVKRVRSDGGEENTAKKAKPLTTFESPEEFQIAIINRSDPDGRMTTERWLEVEARVLITISEGVDDGSNEEAQFDRAG